MSILQIDKQIQKTTHNMPLLQMHSHYEIYFLLSGTRYITTDEKTFVAPPKSLFIFPPFTPHKTQGGIYTRININVSKELLSLSEQKFLNSYAAQGVLQLDPKYFDSLIFILEEAKKMNVQETEGYLQHFLKTLLYLLQKQTLTPIQSASTTTTQSLDTTILKILDYLNENYPKKITLDDLSANFFVSKFYLCKQFNKELQISIMSYLLKLRIAKAKELLISIDTPLETIAERCGFSSANYFSLIFKKETGVSPLNYKKEYFAKRKTPHEQSLN